MAGGGTGGGEIDVSNTSSIPSHSCKEERRFVILFFALLSLIEFVESNDFLGGSF